jgi:hypothetical protein
VGRFRIALVSFDRVFEILDLEPLITERPAAYQLTQTREAGWRWRECGLFHENVVRWVASEVIDSQNVAATGQPSRR